MTINRHLERISQKDPDSRRQALEEILLEEGLDFTLQEAEPAMENPRGTRNYLLTAWNEAPSFLLCAHHDAVPGSFGANDNGAAICILIELAKALKAENFPARFAFFDGEEAKNAGSKLYASTLDKDAVTGVINLDVCGYGDTLAVCGRGHEKKPPFLPLCQKEFLKKHSGQLVKYLPPSDDSSFKGQRIPVMSIAVVPRWDIQYLKALATYSDGLLGRPPEFDMIMGQMEVISTMHGGYRDTPEWIEPEAMELVYSYLFDGLHLPSVEKKKRFGLFSGGTFINN